IKGSAASIFIQYGTSDSLNEDFEGYPTLRLNELNNLFIEYPAKYCNSLSTDQFKSLKLKKNDVVICRTNGNPNLVGKTAIILEDTEYAFASYLFRVRTNNKVLLPQVLVCYLNTKYGRAEVDKHSMTSNQTNFSPARFRKIQIPKFSTNFQSKIEQVVNQAYQLKTSSFRHFENATKTLLVELNLETWQPPKLTFTIGGVPFQTDDNINEIQLDQVLKSNRIDSEYWQSYLVDLEDKVKSYSEGYAELSAICKIHSENYVPKSDQEYRYIELSNIGGYGNVTGHTLDYGKNLPTRARRKVKTGQVIISSIEGSIDKCALITKSNNDSICTNGFHVIDSDSINSETLIVIMKSLPFQNLLIKGCSGTILQAINPYFFGKLIIPKVKNNTQQSIKDSITKMYAEREFADQLIEIGKKATELYVEKDESTGLKYITGQCKELGL
ncbi:MAG: hypothetical protein AAFW00_26700, partial [Bacteroidota bacterium]